MESFIITSIITLYFSFPEHSRKSQANAENTADATFKKPMSRARRSRSLVDNFRRDTFPVISNDLTEEVLQAPYFPHQHAYHLGNLVS
jgi:hypothetical protein